MGERLALVDASAAYGHFGPDCALAAFSSEAAVLAWEKWPARRRWFINTVARASGAPRLVELSHPVVEAGVFESPEGAALLLANFTYQRISRLGIGLPVKRAPQKVRSLEKGPLEFTLEPAPPIICWPSGFRQTQGACSAALSSVACCSRSVTWSKGAGRRFTGSGWRIITNRRTSSFKNWRCSPVDRRGQEFNPAA
ncbi:MAG: hypothetical protein ABSF95_05820 [Verrucomicrobiota bacterium]